MFRELKEKFTKKLVASDLDKKKMRIKVNVLDYATIKVYFYFHFIYFKLR